MVGAGDRLFKLIKWLLVLVILGGIALAVVPLNLYYDQVKSQLRPVALKDISGSAVKGGAGELSYLSLPMGKAEWLLYPSSYNALGGRVKLSDTNYDQKHPGICRLETDQSLRPDSLRTTQWLCQYRPARCDV